MLLLAAPCRAEERLAFIGVALDQETRQADKKLQDYLYRRAGVSFAPEELEYGLVVDRLTRWRPEEGHFVARTTPYVQVAAEMLGANLELLGTYISSATQKTTYSSYFVVRRSDFAVQPELSDVIRFIATSSTPRRFIYHNRFSTSSFFLPSLFLRAQKVFHMPASTESLVAISSRQIEESSSSALVKKVASGEADLAAIWDATRDRFGPDTEAGSKVYFVQLPTALPNDLLVCSVDLDETTKQALRTAVQGMDKAQIGIGDFMTWQDIREASEARAALADLRWLARERPAPATVEVRSPEKKGADPTPAHLLEAVRQAIRFAGTELVLFDQDYHEHIDFVWTVELTHDGAVVLRSAIPGSGVRDQVFQISFGDSDDLTRRMVSIIHSRLHRVRYVWPYGRKPPVIFRDLAFSVPAGTVLKAQRISWLDPDRNSYRGGPLFDVRVRESGPNRWVLEDNDLPAGDQGELDFDPMSNSSVRVLLLRAQEEPLLFRVLTVAFVALLAVAAAAAVLALRRPAPAQAPRPASHLS